LTPSKATRFFIVSAAVLAASGALHRWVYRTRAQAASAFRPLPIPLSEIPAQLGPFVQAQEFDLAPDVLRVARVDSFVHREYTDSRSKHPILLYIGYWGRPNVGLGHGPEVCFPAVGWRSEGAAARIALRFPGNQRPREPVDVAIHHFSRADPEGIKRLSVGFVAVVGGRFQPSSRGAYLHGPPMGTREAFVAHVQVATAVSNENWAEADLRVRAFLEQALPAAADCLLGEISDDSSDPRP
jgi:hypothetical protein